MILSQPLRAVGIVSLFINR